MKYGLRGRSVGMLLGCGGRGIREFCRFEGLLG